jgi:hypothetical protein
VHRDHHAGQPTQYLRYAQIQARYLQWCQTYNHNPFDDRAATVLNFLAEGRSQRNWAPNTLSSYRSAILDMFPTRDNVQDLWSHKLFFKAVNDSEIRSLQTQHVNLSPIIEHLQQLGDNANLSLSNLTIKLGWLLGVCGFMRPSDIKRVDTNQCEWSTSDSVLLTVVAPKEKRLGQRITKTVHIRPDPNPVLCPVATFKAYVLRTHRRACLFPHPVLPQVTLNYLIRDLRNDARPIYAQRISKNIQTLMSLLPQPRSGKLKARALGSPRLSWQAPRLMTCCPWRLVIQRHI